MAAATTKSWTRWTPVLVPYAWLLIFFLIPFLIVFKISLSQPETAIPPYVPTLDLATDGLSATWDKIKTFTLDNYRRIFASDIYYGAYFSSVWIAAVATFLTLLIAYPVAYGMARAPEHWRPMLLMFIILPFWTSFLIRVYAWMGILSTTGFLNMFLQSLGVIDQPLEILNTNTAVYIGIVYSYLPFMVLPLYAAWKKWTTPSSRPRRTSAARPSSRSGRSRSRSRCRA